MEFWWRHFECERYARESVLLKACHQKVYIGLLPKWLLRLFLFNWIAVLQFPVQLKEFFQNMALFGIQTYILWILDKLGEKSTV